MQAKIMIAASVDRALANSRAKLGQAAGEQFADRVQGDRNYADLLGRLWAQVDAAMGELETSKLTTVEKTKVLATVARLLPQLQAAEQNWQMALNRRAISSLTGRELKALVQAIDQPSSRSGG